MLKRLKADSDGNISFKEWFEFVKSVRSERGDAVLEGFLTYCEGIIDSKCGASEELAAHVDMLLGHGKPETPKLEASGEVKSSKDTNEVEEPTDPVLAHLRILSPSSGTRYSPS